jgi:two-component system, OmpR family, sensor kinase
VAIPKAPVRGRRRRRTLNPNSWPVRWRLAIASASLTLAILLAFGGIVGYLAGERIRDDFDRELRGSVRTLAEELVITGGAFSPPLISLRQGPSLDDFAGPNDASLTIFDAQGAIRDASSGALDLGPPRPGVTDVGEMRVATAALQSPSTGEIAGYIQYARSGEQVDSTIARLWLLIAAGILGGTLLASLAGLTIADRAMRPIASLTSTARQIGATRDPSRRMPAPGSDDEVGELALTLDEMLRSLDAARAEREAAMTRQREFVADASHELRTPLTSVIANLELLEESLRQERQSDQREVVDSALRSSRRMSRLVADLLLLARADAGRTSERRRCDAAEIAENAAAEVAAFAGSRTVTVQDGTPMPIEGNPDELHRMVLNLLENAVRHTPEGTSVELRLGTVDGAAVIEVADDGPGIPEGMREQVFERFVRGSGPADTSAAGGTGLGLAIVRAVARSHGGEVESGRSAAGGALFRVRLPLARSEEAITAALEPL